jgi:hypothetical protein
LSRFREQKILLEQCWKVEKYIPKVLKNTCTINCNFFAVLTGSVALWSETKIWNHNATVLQLWVTLTSQKWPQVTFVPSNVHVQLWSISDETSSSHMEKCWNWIVWFKCSEWPWTFQNDLVHKPLSQGTFVIHSINFW